MPLILIIEPDRRQADRVAALAPDPVDAEVLVVESVDEALAALDRRVPDLLLTPPLLSTKDDAALTARLRELDSRGVELQTLVIPVLASEEVRPAPVEKPGGLLNRLRKQKPARAADDGCAPAVFAAQINEYLARVEAERRDREEALGREPWAPPHLVTSALMLEDLLPPSGAEPTLQEPLEPTSVFDDAPAETAPAEPIDIELHVPAAQVVEPAYTAQWEDLESVLEDLRVEAVLPTIDATTTADESEPDVIELPSPDELWTALENAPHQAIAPIEGPQMKRRHTTPPRRTPKAPRLSGVGGRQRQERRAQVPSPSAKPMQDEWGLYDPEQCGFAALLDRLRELTESEESDPDRERRSAIMRR
jgi:hypothetical protein